MRDNKKQFSHIAYTQQYTAINSNNVKLPTAMYEKIFSTLMALAAHIKNNNIYIQSQHTAS